MQTEKPLDPNLKQRLVGAVVLVALAVIFIPMLLDGGRRDALTASENGIPPKPGFYFEPLDIPPQEPEALEPRPAVVEQAATPIETGPLATATTVAEPAPAKAPPSTAQKPPQPKPLIQPKPVKVEPAQVEAWAVQVGSFSSADNALGLRDRLRSKGFSAFVEKLQGDKGMIYRVRVGPEASREAAEALKGKVTAAFDLPALVMSHP